MGVAVRSVAAARRRQADLRAVASPQSRSVAYGFAPYAAYGAAWSRRRRIWGAAGWGACAPDADQLGALLERGPVQGEVEHPGENVVSRQPLAMSSRKWRGFQPKDEIRAIGFISDS